jgi:peptidoglycan hydrolase-like protein with peptidoglycan-binding domain
MSYSLTWLPAVLEAANLKVASVPGWESRGRAEMGTVLGVICHTTVGPRMGNMPSLDVLINGRSDLKGPLSQLGLGRDGTYYVIAAGRCNHAGAGNWQGLDAGNSNFIGIEGENTGRGDEPWPDIQLDAYRRGVAALLKHTGRTVEFCAGHKEYALPHGRKSDPDFDMVEFRRRVALLMDGSEGPRELIPAREDDTPEARPTLRRGASSPAVLVLQRLLGAVADGVFGPATEALVREVQRRHQLVPDGIVGPKTWQTLAPR